MQRTPRNSRSAGAIGFIALMVVLLSRSALGQCTQWLPASEVGPEERHYAAMAYDSGRGVTVLFGGRACCPWSYYGDTWEWEGQTWTRVATDGPSARAWHLMTYDSARGVTVLYGGSPHGDGETWEWDGAQWRLATTEGPTRDLDAALAYDAARGECVLFTGGWRNRSETWTWDGQTWTLVSQQGPSPTMNAAMAYDSARERVVMCGGRYGDEIYNQTWEWDGESWSLISEREFERRSSHSLAYDPVRGVTLMMGGFLQSGGFARETWAWDGVGWTKLADQLWDPFSEPDTLVVDPIQGVGISYGGWGTETRTLEVAPQLWFRHSPKTVVHDAGERAEFAAVADGVGELSYQWYFDGRRLTDFGPFSGAQSSTLTIDPVSAETSGPYTLTVTTSCGSITSAPAHLIVVNPQITVYNDCFASNQVAVVWKQATPRSRVHLLYARRPGSWNVPPLRPCAGTPLDLDRATTILVYSGTSDFNGKGLLHRIIDPSACGGYLQMIDEATCRTSNVAHID